jgi:hypothetical protein
MKYLQMVGTFGLILLMVLGIVPKMPVEALDIKSSQSVVISQIQTGGLGTGTAGQEYIELHNNSVTDVNVTGWCVMYSSGSGATTSQVGCIAAPDSNTTVWLEAGKRMSFTSPDFELATSFLGDISFEYGGGMAAASGHVSLQDGAQNQIDTVGWGSALNPETVPASAAPAGKSLQRKAVGAVLQDTNNNFEDFMIGATTPTLGGLFEVTTITDVCPNLDGVQQTVPNGYDTNCEVVDICPNLDGVQVTSPDGYILDEGLCKQDQCLNIEGLQTAIPDRHVAEAFVCAKVPAQKLLITELLPNPSGDDTAGEFIELYNPNTTEVALNDYRLNIGPNFDKQFMLPTDIMVPAKSYIVIYSKLGYFTLVNTTSRVQLADDTGVVVDQSPSYADAANDMAWALVDDTWQYTNQPTPGAENVASVTEEESVSTSTTVLAPCGEGKYRNPLTNRCRNIDTDAAVLAACDADEYRNPDTNRCRKIVTATLAACDPGEERNPATNRCRNILAAATTLAACKEGQERNPDTNRCRAVKSAAAGTKEPYAVVATATPASVRIGWVVAGVAAAAALGYGAYEWRSEIGAFLRKFAPGKK